MHSGILASFLSIYSLQIYRFKQPEHIFSGLQQGYIEVLASIVENASLEDVYPKSSAAMMKNPIAKPEKMRMATRSILVKL